MGNSIGWPQTADKDKAVKDFNGALLNVLTDIALFEANTFALVRTGDGCHAIVLEADVEEHHELIALAHGNGNIEVLGAMT